jgi:hypothetical protein
VSALRGRRRTPTANGRRSRRTVLRKGGSAPSDPPLAPAVRASSDQATPNSENVGPTLDAAALEGRRLVFPEEVASLLSLLLRGRRKFTTDLSRYVLFGLAATPSVFGPYEFPVHRRVAAEAIGEALEHGERAFPIRIELIPNTFTCVGRQECGDAPSCAWVWRVWRRQFRMDPSLNAVAGFLRRPWDEHANCLVASVHVSEQFDVGLGLALLVSGLALSYKRSSRGNPASSETSERSDGCGRDRYPVAAHYRNCEAFGAKCVRRPTRRARSPAGAAEVRKGRARHV